MKKILLSMVAAVAMLATSCVTDATNDLTVGNESVVTFSVESQNASRAIADGTKATRLQYAVFSADEDGTPITYLRDLSSEVKGTVVLDNLKANFDLTLLNQNYYTIVFWADAQSSIYSFTPATATVTADYTNVTANNDNLDAFYAVKDFKVNGTTVVEAKLKRPFAQVNFATNDIAAAATAGFDTDDLSSEFKATVCDTFNLVSGTVSASSDEPVTFEVQAIPGGKLKTDYTWVAMNYVFASENGGSLSTCELTITDGSKSVSISYPQAPVKRNWKTNLIGALLTGSTSVDVEILPDLEDTIEKEISVTYNGVNYETVTDAIDAAVADTENDSPIITVSGEVEVEAPASSTIVPAGKNLTLDMKEGAKMTFIGGDVVSRAASNQIVFDVRGEMTINGGTIEYEYKGENMGWGAMTTIFNVTAGGILNLNGVTAENKGGTDMGFVAHLNNWGTVTLNAENCTLKSNYVPVRVFNSGPDMNNVTIKNSTLEGGSAAFWVHNYTVADFGTEAKAEAQKALLNLNIYNQDNTFSPDINGIRYGFTNSIRTDAYGITKSVSEDGTIVTLGSVVENGLVRRGVAGDEENTTIKKVVIEEGVGVLYDRTFRRYYALEEVVLPSTLTTIGAAGSGVFQSCTNLKNIVIPESVTVLGKGSFQECSSLESINIPAGVTRIEADALRATGLVEVEFHEGVTYFGAQAFRDCKQLKKVVINAPEFTVEANAFGIMSGTLPGTVIEVANAEMRAYLEKTLAYANQFTVVAPAVIDNTADLQSALANGEYVALANDLTVETTEMLTAPYGNKMAFSHNGGVFNGNGKAISVKANGDNYVVMTNGGTIKNLDINRGFRGIVLMYPNQDVHVDNVNIGVNDEVCYTINTAEGDGTHSLYVSNSVLNGWCSIGTAVKTVTFTNCTFGQGTYYTDVFGRLVKPYVDAVFDGCDFCSKCYLDLSAFVGTKVVVKNCTVNGVKLTAENWTSLIAPEDSCGEGQISVELKNGTYLTAENVADYIVIE